VDSVKLKELVRIGPDTKANNQVMIIKDQLTFRKQISSCHQNK